MRAGLGTVGRGQGRKREGLGLRIRVRRFGHWVLVLLFTFGSGRVVFAGGFTGKVVFVLW